MWVFVYVLCTKNVGRHNDNLIQFWHWDACAYYKAEVRLKAKFSCYMIGMYVCVCWGGGVGGG